MQFGNRKLCQTSCKLIFLNLFQAYLWIFREMRASKMNQKFAFPLEVLIAAPTIVILTIVLVPYDHLHRFRLVYPSAISTIGVLMPLYIIDRNDKMKNLLKQNVYQCTISFSFTFLKLFKKYPVHPQEIQLIV